MICNFYESENGRVQFTAFEGGEVSTLSIDGEEFYTPETVKNNFQRAAKIANEDYEYYKGWSDLHILLEASNKHECCDCSWQAVCELYAKEHE